MSKTNGITKSRNKVDSYKGFSIIQVLAVHHWWNQWDRRYEMSRQYETKREVYYEFCKEGDENRPAQAYNVYPYPKTVEATKEAIDKMLSGKEMYFTDAEREKYIYAPNRKCQWAYGYDSLMKIMRQHQKADKRIQTLLEDRLTDANFHSACSYLCKGDYTGFEEFVADDCKLREKFEVYTYTKRKRIKDPKQFEAGLKKVIEDYLASQGVKDTEAGVTFIENW
jgi:hypothetical protein